MQGAGIVFGATGKVYRGLARRAARNVRQVMPDIPIDLFTDTPLEDPVFARVHLLDRPSFRPKFEALRRSRFDRTLFLDCDAVVVNDVSDIFELLGRADLVGAHEAFGSAPISMEVVRKAPPAAFRQINGGVLGIRKSDRTDAFLRRWQEDFETLKLQFDQPLLRELLWDSDLRVIVLPMEYNHMFPPYIRASTKLMMAPRILHLTQLHIGDRHAEPPDQPFNPAELLPAPVRDRFNALLKTDRTLGAGADARVLVGDALRRAPVLYRLAKRLRGLLH